MVSIYLTEIQARVHSVGVCGTDIHYLKSGALFDQPLLQPMVLGHETAAEIIKVGPGVENFKPGKHCDRRLSAGKVAPRESLFSAQFMQNIDAF